VSFEVMLNLSNFQMDFQISTGQKNDASQIIQILIVDDQNFARQKIQQMLETELDFEIVGTAANGLIAVSQVASLHPDIVLLDLEMPGTDGIKTVQVISERYPQSQILVLSGHEEQKYISKSLQAGAKRYLPKSISTEELRQAIRSVFKDCSNSDSKWHEQIQSQPAVQTPISEAYNRSKTTPLPIVQTRDFVPPISKWLTVGGIAIISTIALAIPIASVLNYKTTVKAEAIVRPIGELRLVQAAIQGSVTKILVKNGQTVKRGDVIATLDNSQLLTKKSQLQNSIEQTRSQLARFDEQIQAIESQIRAETNRSRATIASAEAELNGTQQDYQDKKETAITEVRETQAKLRATEAGLTAAKTKENGYRTAADEGAISLEQLAEAELAVKQQEQELAAAKAALARTQLALTPNPSEIAIAKTQIEQEKNAAKASTTALAREKQALLQQRIESDKQLQEDQRELQQTKVDITHTALVSSTQGTIAQFKLRNTGQTVQPGEKIAEIVPSNAPLEIKAAVSPQDRGKLEVGQTAQMRVSSCIYTDYGSLTGVVHQISQDTIKPEPEASKATDAKAFYEVIIAPNSSLLGKGNNQCFLTAGMDGKADITTKEETVLHFILRKARLLANV
jgi:HlyD family type I secretion membrane fusion protein